MDSPLNANDDRIDSSGTVIADQTCRRCGYNLRGLNREGRCPECGSPVGLSLQGDLLRFADPEWVARLARGSSFILNGLAIAIIAGIVGALASVYVSSTPQFHNRSPLAEAAVVGCMIVALLGLIVSYFGVWIMTSPDPTRIGEDLYATSRKLVRITLLIAVGNMFAQLVTEALTLPELAALLLSVLDMLAALAWIIWWLAYLSYLGKLALRIPDEKLRETSRFLFRAFLIAPPIWIIATIIALTADAGMSVGCGAAVFFIIMLIFVLMALRLQRAIGRACREQATIARATWAADTAGPERSPIQGLDSP